MFLFIAGFSLVLSLSHTTESPAAWLARLGKRMGTLYLISVVFALADQGVQWPGVLVSSGVLGIIAIGVFSAGLMLVAPRPWLTLEAATLAGIAVTYILDSNHISIIGLNAGAGGMLPLCVLAYLGALSGMAYQRWQLNGLGLLFGASLLVGIIALLEHSPWITSPVSAMTVYPGDRLQSILHSLQAVVGLYDGPSQTVQVRYWNHGWIFAFRALPILLLGLIVFIAGIRQTNNAALRFLDWMGRQALNLYILHLILLAAVEVSGLKPVAGWQTLLLVATILAMAPFMLRVVSFVPLRFILPKRKSPE